VLEVFVEGVANNYLVVQDFLKLKMLKANQTYKWSDLRIAWCVLQVIRLDSSDPFSVVLHFCPRLYQSVKDDVAVKVDDRDAC